MQNRKTISLWFSRVITLIAEQLADVAAADVVTGWQGHKTTEKFLCSHAANA